MKMDRFVILQHSVIFLRFYENDGLYLQIETRQSRVKPYCLQVGNNAVRGHNWRDTTC